MASIINLQTGDLSAASSIPFYDPENGADRRASVSALAALLQTLLSSAGSITQYAAPNATGFSVTIAPPTVGASVWLLLTPVAGYAAGTIVLPGADLRADGQEVTVSCTQAVTTLTVSGGTINGAPATLAANGFFKLRFDGVLGAWYRVG